MNTWGRCEKNGQRESTEKKGKGEKKVLPSGKRKKKKKEGKKGACSHKKYFFHLTGRRSRSRGEGYDIGRGKTIFYLVMLPQPKDRKKEGKKDSFFNLGTSGRGGPWGKGGGEERKREKKKLFSLLTIIIPRENTG